MQLKFPERESQFKMYITNVKNVERYGVTEKYSANWTKNSKKYFLKKDIK